MANTINPEIPEDAIRIRSYAIWEHEGRPQGRHVDHWLLALKELRTEATTAEGARQIAKPRAPRAKKS